ncbi:MAG: hypothetical protein GF344_15830, partial [Chitinivibrionales bacterium]|nr:hypothetical protein [Chitinivibrionales bacterium]
MKKTEVELYRESLLKRYESLDPVKRRIVQMVAVVGKSLSSTAIRQGILNIGLSRTYERLVSEEIKRFVDELIECDLLAMDGGRITANSLIGECIALGAAKEHAFDRLLNAVRRTSGGWQYDVDNMYWGDHNPTGAALALRNAVYKKDVSLAREPLEALRRTKNTDLRSQMVYVSFIARAFDAQYLRPFDEQVQDRLLYLISLFQQAVLEPTAELCEYLRERIAKRRDPHGWWRCLLAENLLLRGEIEQSRGVLGDCASGMAAAALGTLRMLEGGFDEAGTLFEQGLAALCESQQSSRLILPGISGCFHVAWHLRRATAESLEAANDIIMRAEEGACIYDRLTKAFGTIPLLPCPNSGGSA